MKTINHGQSISASQARAMIKAHGIASVQETQGLYGLGDILGRIEPQDTFLVTVSPMGVCLSLEGQGAEVIIQLRRLAPRHDAIGFYAVAEAA